MKISLGGGGEAESAIHKCHSQYKKSCCGFHGPAWVGKELVRYAECQKKGYQNQCEVLPNEEMDQQGEMIAMYCRGSERLLAKKPQKQFYIYFAGPGS
ncbi:hypothetical protein BSKO_08375 [Bryopsis sp. KO-2023]|nr:hypothetical protein BSKO_08375 [Bryopsis sp. KO-2023]